MLLCFMLVVQCVYVHIVYVRPKAMIEIALEFTVGVGFVERCFT